MTRLGILVALLLAVSGFAAQVAVNALLINRAVAAGRGAEPPPECSIRNLGETFLYKGEVLACVPMMVPDDEQTQMVWAVIGR